MAPNSTTFASESETENVSVVVRVRPLSFKEETQNCRKVASIKFNDKIIELSGPKGSKMPNKAFHFDHIFPDDSSQLEVYKRVALPIVDQIFQGYNGTIFAYGQTGSGKTFTMCGNQNDEETQGIIPNAFEHIFRQISRAGGQKSFVVTAIYLEIYNEEVRDLLSPNPNVKLQVRENKDGGVSVRGLTGFTVDSVDAMNRLMCLGNSNRTTRATLMNNLSSRSHAIFTVTVEAKDSITNKVTVAKLNLVDLAGSERLKRSEATGMGLKEASNINQSLFVLSNVISALAEKTSSHVPYRNSKLTRLLQDSLGGNSKTVMIATISPNEADFEESLCTLRYAGRAKLIKNYIRPNVQTNEGLIENFEREILELKKRLDELSLDEEVERPSSRRMLEFERHKEEIKNIEKVKNHLNEKIQSIQNKILVGGENLFDKAERQKSLLESSFEEIKFLEKRHQEQQEELEEREIQYYDLQEEHYSLTEENKILTEKIPQFEKALKEITVKVSVEEQDHKQEIQMLLDQYLVSSRELQCMNELIKLTIPLNQLNRIEENMVWNSRTCDFQINGIAQIGNNIKSSKRRFRKHIPKSALMGSVLNVRKNIMHENKVVFEKGYTRNVYGKYMSQRKFEKSGSGFEEGRRST